jgi:hypothetical protein
MKKILTAAVCVLSFLFLAMWIYGRPILSTNIRRFPMPGQPDRFSYSVTFWNFGMTPVNFDAVKMPGGYAGNGTFFPCEVDVKEKGSDEWHNILLGTSEEMGQWANRVVRIVPLQGREVCWDVLPLDREPDIKCVHIAVHRHFGRVQNDEVASTVVAGAGATKRDVSCVWPGENERTGSGTTSAPKLSQN